MADFSDAKFNGFFNSEAKDNVTKVNVEGINDKALNGIIEAINQTRRTLDDLSSSFDDEADREERRERTRKSERRNDIKDESVKSEAALRRQKAADNALNFNMKNQFKLSKTLLTTFKGAMEKLGSIISKGFDDSLRSFSDLSKSMRKQNLTKEQKDAIQMAVSKSMRGASDIYGKNVSRDTAARAYTEATQKGFYFAIEKLNDKQQAAFTALFSQGLDVEEAYQKASTLQESTLKTIIEANGDVAKTYSTVSKELSLIDKTFISKLGGQDEAEKKILEVTNSIAKIGSGWLSQESQVKLAKTFLNLKGANFTDVDPKILETILGGQFDTSMSAEEMMESFVKRIESVAGTDREKDLIHQLQILSKGGVGDDQILNSIMNALNQAKNPENNGRVIRGGIRTSEQDRQGNEQNTEKGKIYQGIDNFVSQLDVFTGGMIGSLSNTIDEWFGDSTDITEVTKDGFKLVTTILGGILAAITGGKIISGIVTGLGGLAGWLGLKKAGKAAGELAGAGTKATSEAAGAGTKAVGKLGRFAKSAGKLGALGVLAYGGYSLISSLSGDNDDNTSQIQSPVSTSNLSGDYYSNMLSIVSDIRDHLVSTINNTVKTEEALKEIPDSLRLSNNVLQAVAKNPLEQVAARAAANAVNKSATSATTEVLQQGLKTAAEQAAAKGSMVAAKAGLKIAGKALGPLGLAVEAGIGIYDTAQQMSVANQQEALGTDLSKELFKKKAEIEKAKLNNDNKELARLTMEANAIEAEIDNAALRQEEASDNAVIAATSAAGGIAGGIAGAATGAAIGSLIGPIGTVVGGAIGAVVGGLGIGLGAGSVSEVIVQDTPEQRAEKIREKREKYQAELRARQQSAIDRGISESLAIQLVAYSKDQAQFENKLDGLVEMNRLNLSEQEMSYLAEKADSTEDMRNLTMQLLSDPQKVYSNVGSIAVNIEAMRTNLMSIYHRVDEIEDGLRSVLKFADGGIVNKATPAIVGEDGKEAIVPLEKPNEMRNILTKLSLTDKRNLLKALFNNRKGRLTWDLLANALLSVLGIGSSSATEASMSLGAVPTPKQVYDGVPGDDPETIRRILEFAGPNADMVYERMLHGWKGNVKDGFKQRKKWYDEAVANAANQEGRDLIRGTYAERALEYGVAELGKPYILRSLGKIGYVCNELVNAAIGASGFKMGKFRVNGVKATFANIQKGKMNGEGYANFRIRDDLTPQTAVPGMVFFQDSRKNKDGGFQPGHIGLVYYGHQKLHAAGGSSDYTKEGFLPNWQTPCRGVTVTPFDSGSYVIGEFPGLFEKATGEWNPPVNPPVAFGPSDDSLIEKAKSQLNKNGILSDEDMQSILKEAGVSNSYAMKQYIAQARELVSESGNSEDIIAILTEIARYLRGMSSKPPMVAATRPHNQVYGR
jgi:hypothetical protein